MAKRTLGPWALIKDGGTYAIVAFDGKVTVMSSYGDTPETEADWQLMSAAPELLAALKDCHALIVSECADGEYMEQAAKARAAIAKAEGNDG